MNAKTLSAPALMQDGLWYNNPGIVQLLGLCPLLAVSNSAISAIGLGLATTLVLIISNTIISLCRHSINYELRIPYFMLIIACVVTCVIFLLQVVSYELYQTFGVYLALITTNCVILGRIEAFAYKHSVYQAFIDGLANGLGFSAVLFILGSIRELIGHGTLFANAHLLFGKFGQQLAFNFNLNLDGKFILAILPPGAFFTLGILIAAKNFITKSKTNCRSHQKNLYEQSTNLADIPTLATKKS